MKKVVRILLAILMVMCLALGFAACKSDCEKGNHDAYIKSETAATCTTAKVEHWACNNCDWTEDKTVGTALGHDFTNVKWTPSATDADKHERACTRCDYKETANHTTGAATCPDCGKDLGGSVIPCDHSNKTMTETAATCTTAKVEHWTCPDCDWTEDKTVGEPLGHDVKEWTVCEDDDTKHEGTCTREGCGVKVTEAHTPNEAGDECTKCHANLGGGVEPHEHDYNGQAWQIDETNNKHYQVCKVSGCDERNEHAINMGNWTVVDGKHQQSCTVAGCGVAPTIHDAAFGSEYVTTDDTNHYKQCANCTLKDEIGEHNHTASQIEGNDEQHAVACSVCGKQFDNVDHTSVKVDSIDATCTTAGKGEGSKCSVCDYVITEGATSPALKHDYTDVDWTLSTTDATKHERGCTRCDYVDVQDHTWDTEWANDSTNHWHDCTKCEAIKDEAEHDFGNEGRDLSCNVCDEVNPSSEFNYVVVYTLDGERVRVGYIKLADALDALAANEDVLSATISVRGDGEGKTLNGLGVVIPEGHNITIDLNGATYVVASEPVGSTGTETNGFQILKNSNVIIKDGTITSAEGSGVKLLIQNYANLTLDGVTVDGTHLDGTGIKCTLSNNYGTVAIINKSRIIAKTANDVAFDVYYNMGGNYPNGVKVTVDDSCRITGMVAYGSAQANVEDLATNAVLTLPAGTYKFYFTKNVTDCTATGITIDGETLTHKLSTTLTHELVEDVHKHYATCSLCNSKVYTDCTWGKGVVTVAANCVTPKVTTYTCTACSYEKEVTGDVDNTKHDFDATIKDNVTVTKPATCTEKGTMTVKCSRCDAEKTGVEIPMVAHEYDTTKFVSVSATEHAHKCANCDAYQDAAKHTYTANHCATCGGDITQEQIIALMADLLENGEKYDPLVSSGSTFVLTGVYNGLYNNITSNYQLVDDEGNHLIVVYQLDVADLIVGDKITVTGKITFFTDKNGDRIQFGNDNSHEVAERGQSNVTVNVVDDEGNTSDKATYTLTGVTNGKATNMSTVTLTVNVDSNWIINKVSADIVAVDYDAATKTYSLTVKGDTVITIQVKEDDGKRTYEVVAEIETKQPTSSSNLDSFTDGTVTITFAGSSDSNRFQTSEYRMYNGTTATVTVSDGFTITKLVFTTDSSGKNTGANLVIDGSNLTGASGEYAWTNSNPGTTVTIGNSAQVRIKKISVTYTITVECKHIDAEEVTAKAAACGKIGFKVDGIYCSTCKHFTTNGWDKLADNQIIPALEHDYESVAATTGTCLVKEVDAHYTCKNCDKLFIDENETKKVVTLEEITGALGDHSYGAWTHVADTATHSKTCSVCNDTVTEGCASDTYLNNTTHHWKVCDVCNVKFGETTHTGDTSCVCGAWKLTYKVVDSEGATVADAINTASTIVTGYAKAGENVNVTIVAADTHKVNTVASDGLFTAQGNNVYTGKLAANGEIVVTVEAKQSATYKELIVNGINEDNVIVSLNNDDITSGQTLNAGDVIDIMVDYDSANYDLTVVVNQGNDHTIDMIDDEGTYTGSYTCLGLGEVKITVTLTAKASVTVTGNGTVTVNGVASDAQKWSKGSEITIVATADDGYALDDTPFTVTAGATLKEGNTYTVTGDVTITVNATELVTVMIIKDGEFNAFSVTGAGIVGDVEFDEDGMAMIDVKINTQITISATPTDATHTAYATIGDTKTAFTDNTFKATASDSLEIKVTTEVPKSWKLATASNLVDGAKIVITSTSKNAIAGELGSFLKSENISELKNINDETKPFGATNAQFFVLEEISGSSNWAIRFDGETDKYLSWESGNSAASASSSASTSAQWQITTNADSTQIANAGTPARLLQYNSGSPRFACYTSTQTAVQIYVWC